MGSVWVAHHRALGCDVAIKFMDPRLSRDANFVARFTREARAAAQIKSMHVVGILDHGISPDGVPFIAMELLEGETLQQRLRREKKLNLEDTTLVVRHVCKALTAAHKVGIIHRDIKPANIFLVEVDDDLLCKLIDFGVAKQQADGLSMTRTSDRVGTPFYMCPEALISAKHLDHRSDIWAVAAVAYHCLVGDVPFRADSFADLCIVVARLEYVPASEADPALPPQLDAWFERALVRDPDGRFDSARAMSDAFRRAAQGKAI